jgi:hypothetical protein
MQLGRDEKQVQILPVAMLLIIFGVHMNMLLSIKVRILVLINRAHWS